MSVLSIKNYTKYYDDFKAVDDLSLEINQGEICAFIGHNGAGKTTTSVSYTHLTLPTSELV